MLMFLITGTFKYIEKLSSDIFYETEVSMKALLVSSGLR